MKKALNILLIAIIFSPVIGFIYVTGVKETKIETVTFGDTGYELTISQIGEPDWPFGSTHCRFAFTNGNETISTLNFDIYNDGGPACSKNFHVHWFTEFVRIVVTAEEQPDTLYDLHFDGNTEITESRHSKTAAGKGETGNSARERISRVLGLDIPSPSDSVVQENVDTYRGSRHEGKSYIQIRFDDGDAVLEQIKGKPGWSDLPLPEDLRSLAEYMNDYREVWLPADEELGAGHYWFLDRHEVAADRRDYSAALDRNTFHFLLAFYSIGEETLSLCQLDT